MKLHLIEAMTLAVAAVSGVRALDAQDGPGIRGASLEGSPLEVEAAEADSCGRRCTSNAQCARGGLVTCGECNLVAGTQYYRTCVGPDTWTTPAPTPFNYFPDGGLCAASCRRDRDCQPVGGTYNPCMTCGQFVGTIMHHKCYAEPPTPAPAPYDPFPAGGMCKKSCRHDRDCENGGFNPCGKCGQYSGTLMHHRCYAPQTAVE